MNKPSRRSLFAALVIFAFFCLVRAPVSLVSPFLPRQIQWQHVQGTLWQGQAAALGLGNQIVAERLEWAFLPASLAKGRLEWQLASRFAGKPGKLALSLGLEGVMLKDLDWFLPLEPLLAQEPRLQGLRLGGEVHAQAALLEVGSKADARIEVDGLFSGLVPQQGPLGSYRVDVEMQPDGSGQWKLLSLAGILQAEGRGSFDVNQAKASGQVTLTPQTPIPGLSPALATLTPAGQGYQLSF